MSKNHFLPVHLTISIIFAIWFVVFTVNDILSVGNSYFWLICCTCPFAVAGLLAISSLGFLRLDNQSKLKYLPLSVNVITIIAGVVLFSFADLNKDFGFQWHYQEYAEAVKLIEAGQLQVYPEGYVILPEQYQHLSIFGEASISGSPESKSIYFMYDLQNLDDVSWGYLYRSDGSEPDKEDNCYLWREIEPPVSKWYYCEANRIYWKQGE